MDKRAVLALTTAADYITSLEKCGFFTCPTLSLLGAIEIFI
jgi:hypothetical protein